MYENSEITQTVCKEGNNLEKPISQEKQLSSHASSSSSASKYSKKLQTTQYLKACSDIAMLGSPQKANCSTSSVRSRRISHEVVTTEEFQVTVAPTLPLHSPHSPLHHHSQLQQNKLSARYINNKATTQLQESQKKTETQNKNTPASPRKVCTCSDKTTVAGEGDNNKNISQDIKGSGQSIPIVVQKYGNSLDLFSSTPTELICSCEEREHQKYSGLKSNNTEKKLANSSTITTVETKPENSITKRVVSTRNAATSPHLDFRRLTNMSPASASSVQKKIEIYATSSKAGLEKSNSLNESRPSKQLRTTRSLSPRPPVRHQQAIIVSDENDVMSVKLGPFHTNNFDQLSEKRDHKDNANIRHRRFQNNCKSEQTSPNTTDLTNIKFAYNKMPNRSTGCLVYVPADPWLKITDLDNHVPADLQHKNTTYAQNDRNQCNDIRTEGDPWIKRAETDIPRYRRQQYLRQARSLSATKIYLEGAAKRGKSVPRPKLQRCKSPLSRDEQFGACTSPLKSAPSSPHCLEVLENQFSSTFSLIHTYGVQRSNSSPPRSSSFSPARSRDIQSPFLNFSPSRQVTNSMANREPWINHSFLEVCNPNLIQARHSFSSPSNQQHTNELQFNIRRLSEQTRKPKSSQFSSLSDRNVNTDSIKKHGGTPAIKSNASGADFSDYLKQFHCSEAKKVAPLPKNTFKHDVLASLTDTFSGCTAHSICNTPLTAQRPQESQTQPDPLLETTC